MVTQFDQDLPMTFDQIQKVKQQKGGLQITVQWWGNITETPQLMSEVFRSDSQYNKGTFNWQPDIPTKGGYTSGAAAAQVRRATATASLLRAIEQRGCEGTYGERWHQPRMQ